MAIAKIRLPRLPVNWQAQPQLFERYWDDAMTRLETTLNAILDLPALQAAVVAVQAQVVEVEGAVSDVVADVGVIQAAVDGLEVLVPPDGIYDGGGAVP